MSAGLARVAGLLLLLIPLSLHSVAGELADFNAAVENASVHYRAAIGHLRGGNIDAAATEIEAMRKAWTALTDRFANRPPDAFDGNILYTPTLAEVTRRVARAERTAKARRPEAAREALAPIRAAMSQMRRASGVIVLADCILDANAALDAFYAYKDQPPDWSRGEARFDTAGKSAAYRHELTRCDAMAPGHVRSDPQFRRLIDGAFAGLDLVQKAINARDLEMLGRILTELRSFDSMLTLRFG
jgi:hypothetical protein